MDPATAQEVMEWLRNNPEAAKAAMQQAQRMQQQQPGMAQQVQLNTECHKPSQCLQNCQGPLSTPDIAFGQMVMLGHGEVHNASTHAPGINGAMKRFPAKSIFSMMAR